MRKTFLARGLKVELPGEEFFDDVKCSLPLNGGDAFEERNLLGADLDAVAGFGAVADAAFSHETVEAIFLQGRSGGVIVEQTDLADHGRADEMIGRRVLRTGFEATSATDAAREGIPLLLKLLRHRRAFAQVVCAIDGDPGFNALQIVEQPGTIDEEIADEWEFAHRLELDGAGAKFVHQRGAALADSAVDDHGAGAADFLQASAIVNDLRGGFAVSGRRMGGDVLEAGDDVHVGPARDGKFFPPCGLAWPVLTADAEGDAVVRRSGRRCFRGRRVHCRITLLILTLFFIRERIQRSGRSASGGWMTSDKTNIVRRAVG